MLTLRDWDDHGRRRTKERTMNRENGRSADAERTLPDAARTLGCHIESLRRRIRAGRLPARRGPRGVYLVRDSDLARVWIRPAAGRPARLDEAASWAALESLIYSYPKTHAAAIALLRELRTQPEMRPRLQLVLAVLRLRLSGLTYRKIASTLDISERHARRTARRDLEAILRKELVRNDARRQRAVRAQAGAIVAELERRLRVAGYRGLTRADIINAWPKRIGKRIRRLSEEDVDRLVSIGITGNELLAISVGGIPVEALNYLISHGFENDDPVDH